MPFTIQELDNISNAALDFYVKGKPLSQQIQDKPLLAAMREAQKTFGGGRGEIKGNVKADYTTAFQGYEHDDLVTYVNPANIKQYTFPWKELHAGIQITATELKKAGITIVDTLNGENTSNHSQQELFELSNLLEDKLEDMDEGTARSLNSMFWQDGSASAKVFPGVQAIVADDPTTGVCGGIDRATNTWWRNRALVGANKITADKALQTLTKKLRSEVRQLRRFGGKPTLWLAGSAFIESLELEVFEKGTYTQEGFTNKGKTNIGMAAISMMGVGECVYDPTLDDLGRSKFSYMLDMRHLFPYVMEGEDMKTHNPARPANQYVMYRGVTWTGALTARKLNCHEVIEVA